MTERPKNLSVVEARINLSELLGEVLYTGQPIIIERHGKPMAVLVNPEVYERFATWLQQQERQPSRISRTDGLE